MSNARDIALVFISLEALIIVLIPLLLVGALAYGFYRLRFYVRQYLRLAVGYAQQANDAVNEVAGKITTPFINIHAGTAKVTGMAKRLISGGTREL